MRRALVGLFMICAALCVGGTVAFACTYVPHVYSTSPESGAPGTDVTVTGQAISAKGPVDIRWNGLQGPVLGVAKPDAAGNFSVTVKVPEASPGVYFLVAVAGDSGVARHVFEVTGTAVEGLQAGPAVAPSVATDPLSGMNAVPAPGDPSQGPAWAGAGLVLLTAAGLVLFGGSTAVLAQRRRAVSRIR